MTSYRPLRLLRSLPLAISNFAAPRVDAPLPASFLDWIYPPFSPPLVANPSHPIHPTPLPAFFSSHLDLQGSAKARAIKKNEAELAKNMKGMRH